MTEWVEVRDAVVTFHDFDGRPNYEGRVKLGSGWIYLCEKDTFISADKTGEVIGPDSNKYGNRKT